MALVFVAVRILLGLIFMLTGVMKLTDRFSTEVYAQAVDEFVKFATVYPLNSLKIEPIYYLIAVGWIELVGGLLLVIGHRILQEISAIILAIIMMGAIYSLLMLKKPLYMCTPATVCLGLLLLLLSVGRRDRQKQKEE